MGIIEELSGTQRLPLYYLSYSQIHKTLPKSGLQMQQISVRFYEIGDRWGIKKDVCK